MTDTQKQFDSTRRRAPIPPEVRNECETTVVPIAPTTSPERRKRVALGVEAGKSNRAIAKELGCDEKLVRNDRMFLEMPVEDLPVKKPKKQCGPGPRVEP